MTTKLNPHAPEYKPIQPGISPHPHAPPLFFLPPPPSAAHLPPPRYPLLPHQILTHPPSTSHNNRRQLCPTYSTYYVNPRNQVPTNPSPPQAAVAPPCGSSARGPRGRGRRRERGWSEKIRVGFWKQEQYSKRGMQKEGNRHRIVPLKLEDEQTTVMIKNIPYDCPRKELIDVLDDFCSIENQKAENEGTCTKEHAYDFLYLPIDFKTKKSRGFAFVNFTNSRAVWKFFETFHLKNWGFVERLKWSKKIEIVAAKIQGKEALVNHFSESLFECETDEFLPVCFGPARDGSGQPVEQTVVGLRRPASRWKFRYNHKA